MNEDLGPPQESAKADFLLEKKGPHETAASVKEPHLKGSTRTSELLIRSPLLTEPQPEDSWWLGSPRLPCQSLLPVLGGPSIFIMLCDKMPDRNCRKRPLQLSVLGWPPSRQAGREIGMCWRPAFHSAYTGSGEKKQEVGPGYKVSLQ